MTKDERIRWATAHGWTEDRFGHLQKKSPNTSPGTEDHRHHRLKLSKIAARYEVKTSSGWVRIRSAYYKDLSITADGKLVGMTN